ncbi:site-specific integrase [Allomesorhizobium camelthorni]|uniref:Site-specific integrase n=1 Tax=Allomesorhizobium camelthorni TaxID=475069 RepID=A0A6G4W683_9HYPH|nr:site-specific integrase [Mesorhizobium camelthorni]NGO49763.1 site-specific integrase [Mesorhizobium camelthorni]
MQRLLRRGDMFYFRAAVPTQWRRAINCTEIKLTLRTTDRAMAAVRCRHMSNAFDLFFGRSALLSKPSVQQLDAAVRAYFQEQLNRALLISHDLPDDPALDLDAEIDGLREDIARLTGDLKSKTFDPLTLAKADEIVQVQTPDEKVASLDLVEYVRTGVTRARIERAKYLVKALSGDYSDNSPSDPLFAGMKPESLDDTSVVASGLLTLDEARQRFIQMKKSGKEWVRKTELDYRRVLNLAVSVIGSSKPVSFIGTDDVKSVRDTLANLPSNITKVKGNAEKSLSALIAENPSARGMSPRTQNKYFSMFRSFLQWLLDEEEMPKMPGPSIKVLGSGKSKAQGDRYPYSKEQLQRIFSSPLYRGCSSRLRRATPGSEIYRDGYFWIPLVALYSGLRLGEIVQLGTGDVKQDGEVMYFDVSLAEGDGKHLKTGSSERRVPVHAKLIELGLLDHVAKARKQKKARVFHDIKPGEDGYFSHNMSKWWGRYTRSIKVRTAKTTFHSFRHNFTDALREAEVPDSIAKSLVGHADRSVHAGYGKGASIQKLSEHLNRVEYPIKL